MDSFESARSNCSRDSLRAGKAILNPNSPPVDEGEFRGDVLGLTLTPPSLAAFPLVAPLAAFPLVAPLAALFFVRFAEYGLNEVDKFRDDKDGVSFNASTSEFEIAKNEKCQQRVKNETKKKMKNHLTPESTNIMDDPPWFGRHHRLLEQE